MQQSDRAMGIGLIGLGTVGGGVFRLVESHADDYRARGIDVRIARACCRDAARAAELGVDPATYTADWREVVSDPDVDVVIEVIGGEHPAKEIALEAISAGKHVVTANKALLGRHMDEIAGAASRAGVQLRCEAACAGGIPIVNALEHDLTGNRVLTVAGIVNGTTNYILSRMADEGLGYEEVLADAQRLGYAEADPTADVDGIDAASKIAILSSIAFATRITTDDVYTEGIREVSALDISAAAELGRVIKMLAVARRTEQGVDVRVHPAMIPAAHQLAGVSGAMNAVFVVGDAVGETMFYGAGAGAFPTASAVVGDVMALAEASRAGVPALPEPEPFGRELPVRDIRDLTARYFIRLAGDAAGGAEALDRRGIAVERKLVLDGGAVALVTEPVREGELSVALDGVDTANVIRIEDMGSWTAGVYAN